MKEIRTIKMVEQTEVKFVADDGKVFVGDNAEHECATYERTRDEKKVTEAFQRLDAVELNTPFIEWFASESHFWKILLNSKSDYIAMKDYFKVVRYICDFGIKEPETYPCTLIVSEGYEYMCEYGDKLKEELQKALEQLG